MAGLEARLKDAKKGDVISIEYEGRRHVGFLTDFGYGVITLSGTYSPKEGNIFGGTYYAVERITQCRIFPNKQKK